MKVYSPKSEVYEGEPVDCRELMQAAGYTKEPLNVEEPAKEPKKTDQGATGDAATGSDADDAGATKGGAKGATKGGAKG